MSNGDSDLACRYDGVVEIGVDNRGQIIGEMSVIFSEPRFHFLQARDLGLAGNAVERREGGAALGDVGADFAADVPDIAAGVKAFVEMIGDERLHEELGRVRVELPAVVAD